MSLRFFTLRFARQLMVLLLLSSSTLLFAQNRIVTENQNPGTPQAVWDATDGGTIEGFAQEFTVEPGNTVHFKIDIASGSPVPYTVKIYRIGWYQGNGARFIDDLGNSLTGGMMPPANYDPVTGMTDCNNWPVATQWTVPSNAIPGVYIARMDCPSVGGSAILIFVVKDPSTSLNSDLLFKTSDATWQAYNPYGGNSFYVAGIPVPGYMHATKISYQRVLHMRGDKSNFFNSEYPMIRWLERNGYDVSYTTDQDFSKDNTPLTTSNCRVFLSVGHDEYWSAECRNKVEAARASGVNLAFFSGNEVYWKTRWEDNFQTLVCYKEGSMGELGCNTKCDPSPDWTGLWRDGCTPGYAPNDGCKPEGALTGQMSWTQSIGSIKVPDTYKHLRFWKNTAVESLPPGGTLTLPYGTLGNEWDDEKFTETYPAHRTVLSNTTQTSHVHKMSLYRYPSGGLVFGAGTMQWSWGLDANHDLNAATPPAQPESQDVQQATINLLFDMNAVPGTLQSNLVMPSVLNDVQAPTSVIVSPIHNANVSGGSITISGTSADNGGGALGGVEVSVDGGSTWHIASGYENWSYTFSPSGYGTINIQVRAWDEFGNVETVGTLPSANSIAINLTGPFNYSVFNDTYPQQPPVFYTGGPLELGMKFRSSIPGYITGFKYYKGADVTGTHIGHLWDINGNLLSTETFTNETSSGWQTVSLSTPVLIQPNTTYVVSYFSSSGDFEKTDPFFTQSIQNGYLTGLASGIDGGNGLYEYSSTPAFPTGTSGTSNYWVDVVMTPSDQTPPTVVTTSPANGATDVNLNVPVIANFSEVVDPASVTNLTAYITGPGNSVVPATVTVNGADVTITPNSPLGIVTTYTVTLEGGLTPPQIKDISGNALAADYTWSFTTGGLTAPQVTGNPSNASTCSNAPVSFTSTATGIPTPTVQWQYSSDGGVTWNNILGAISGTYTFTAQSADNGNSYHAVWTNSEGTATSDPATLTVAATISATIAAVNANICPGDPLQLQLTSATGVSPFSLTINSQVYNNISVNQIFSAVLGAENIFGPSDIPAELIHADAGPLEVGVRFKATANGVIKGIRFYKGGVANGGTHIGNLWTTSGTLLGTATFSGETNSGWQEVYFSTPVSVTANTAYIASYFLPQGNYSKSGGFFGSSDFTNGQHLMAPQSAPGEANGLYVYTATSALPTEDAFSTNYWVDVIYAPLVTGSTTFNLTNIVAANGCTLSGNPISSASINVSPTVSAGIVSGTSPLCIGGTTLYSTTGDAGGTWSSSNTGVATVNPTTGAVIAVGAGTTNIIYTVNGCSGPATANQPLTVDPSANAGTVSGAANVCIGATSNYTSNGDAGGAWSSSNTAAATINATTGELTAIAAGTTTLTYTVSVGCGAPVTSNLSVTVNAAANAGTVSGTANVCIGATSNYTSNGDAGGAWSSSNTAAATINATTGELTAIAAGTTTLTYTVSAGCGAPVTSNLSVTVGAAVSAGNVTGTSTLCVGNTAVFTSNGTSGGAWSSSNTAAATVNATTGEVNAIAAGSADINYVISGCNGTQTATLTVTVNSLSGSLAGTPGGGQECRTLTMGVSGTTFTDASCKTIATIIPSGLAPVSGSVNSCVTIDATVQFFMGNPYVQRHYDIEPATDPSGSTATVKLYYTQAEFDAYNLARGIQPALPVGPSDVTGIANLLITQYHGTGNAPGNYSGNAVLINPADANIVWNAITSLWEVSFDVVGFSGFYAYTSLSNVPLPITLLSFDGKNAGQVNVLSWSTSSEQNSDHFELERSLDGLHFDQVAVIAAAGNSATVRQYRKEDNIAGISSHIFYYRLKMVDINGSAKYSSIVVLRTNHKGIYVTATPNPFTDVLRVNINSDKQDNVKILITDVSGRKLIQKKEVLIEGSNTFRLNEFTNMSGGVYFLHIITSTGTEALRVVKQ